MVVTRRSLSVKCTPLKEVQATPKKEIVSNKFIGSAARKRERRLIGDTENIDRTGGSPEKIQKSNCSDESDGFVRENGEGKGKENKSSIAKKLNKCASAVDETDACRASCSSKASIGRNCSLIGREAEYDKLTKYLTENLSSGTSLSLYISGPPGSGKTATVLNVLESLAVGGNRNFMSAVINCISYSNENEIYREICRKFGRLKKHLVVSQLQNEIENIFATTRVPLIIVLDEIDGVKTKNNLFHYSVFQWPANFSKVSLIGIANSLDLTVRILPKLKLLRSPELLTFSPYNKNVLKEIIKKKLFSEGVGSNEGAIELCSRKVAAMTGDVRTAIHIARQMITQITKDNGGDGSGNALVQLTDRITDISVSSAKKARLPLQQKIILATLLRLSQVLNSSIVQRDVLQLSYGRVCSLLSLPLLSNNELCSALSLLEAQMVINHIGTSGYKLALDAKSLHRIIGDESLTTRIINISKEDLLNV